MHSQIKEKVVTERLIRNNLAKSKYKSFLQPIWRTFNIIRNLPSTLKYVKREKILLVYCDFLVFPYDFSCWVLFHNLNFELKKRKCSKFDLIIINDRNFKSIFYEWLMSGLANIGLI